MNRNQIIGEVRADLKRFDKPEFKIDAQQFFKEKLERRYVIKTPIIDKIAKSYFKYVKELSKSEIFELCGLFLGSGRDGEAGIGFRWIKRCDNLFAKSDFNLFQSWLKNYVNNWGSCDAFSCWVFGPLLYQYPELLKKTIKWRRSKSRWYRRASAVSLIYSLGKKAHLNTAFEIADTLLLDEDDMVQKGYGWMLKIASDNYPDDVFNYVIKNKNQMPRTALRYAIEKYPKSKRQQAMKRG